MMNEIPEVTASNFAVFPLALHHTLATMNLFKSKTGLRNHLFLAEQEVINLIKLPRLQFPQQSCDFNISLLIQIYIQNIFLVEYAVLNIC